MCALVGDPFILCCVRVRIMSVTHRCAYFYFTKDDTEIRLVPGDELRLKHDSPSGRAGAWEGNGIVLRFDQTEEVCLEMLKNVSDSCSSWLCCMFEMWRCFRHALRWPDA